MIPKAFQVMLVVGRLKQLSEHGRYDCQPIYVNNISLTAICKNESRAMPDCHRQHSDAALSCGLGLGLGSGGFVPKKGFIGIV